LPPAKWIRHPGPNAVGDYVYTLRILVPNCMLKAAVVLTGSFAADNHASLQVNANAAVNTATTTGFLAPTAIPATTLAPGMNTITVRLHNLHGVTGFLFKGSVTSRCPNEPEKVTPDGLDDQ
jgi:hypothetical protein